MSEQENSGRAEGAPPFRAGYVALCGRPNVGKSTLLNALVGEELAVVTKLPQTTRERMLGIWTTDTFQAVLVDTPGIHRAKSALNAFMVAEALRGAEDVDVVLMLAEAPRVPDADAALEWTPGPGAKAVLEALAKLEKPLILVLTKCDRLAALDLLLPVIDRWRELHPFAEVVATSGLRGRGLEVLREAVVSRLPESPAYYGPDQLSDRDMRWHAAELIRAELFEQLAEEVPYSCAVTIDSFKEDENRDRIRATVHVERESQKGIVIGKGAQRIREVSTRARARISELTGRPCDLRVEVRVSPHWTKDPRQLREFGYADEGAG